MHINWKWTIHRTHGQAIETFKKKRSFGNQGQWAGTWAEDVTTSRWTVGRSTQHEMAWHIQGTSDLHDRATPTHRTAYFAMSILGVLHSDRPALQPIHGYSIKNDPNEQNDIIPPHKTKSMLVFPFFNIIFLNRSLRYGPLRRSV